MRACRAITDRGGELRVVQLHHGAAARVALQVVLQPAVGTMETIKALFDECGRGRKLRGPEAGGLLRAQPGDDHVEPQQPADAGDLVGSQFRGEFAHRIVHHAALVEPQARQETLARPRPERVQRGRAAGEPLFQVHVRADQTGSVAGPGDRHFARGGRSGHRMAACREHEQDQHCRQAAQAAGPGAIAHAALIEVRTQLRPLALAAYMARSAISNASSTSSMASAFMVCTPMLAVMRIDSPCAMQGPPVSALRTASATSTAPCRSWPGRATTNSSPPKRASNASPPRALPILPAAQRRHSSPARWPWRSLIALKWSRSTISSDTGRRLSRLSATMRSKASWNQVRL